MELHRIIGSFAATLLWNALQFAAGGVLALALWLAARRNLPYSSGGARGALASVILFALCGAILPLGTYGVLPVLLVLGGSGLAVPSLAALLVSNRFFDMLLPFADPTFVWGTGYGRLVLAVVVAIAAGLLCRTRADSGAGLLRAHVTGSRRAVGGSEAFDMAALASRLGRFAWKAAIALCIGAGLEALFRGYALREIVGFLFTNPVTGGLASSFAQRNVVSPLVMLGTWCITVLTDFVGLSGLALVLKPKALAVYLGFCAALAAALCSSALF